MRIHSISGPRNISTALMYSFAQRNDMSVVDEPFYGYYLKHTGIDHPGREDTLLSMSTEIETILNETIRREYKTPNVFFKNMAHHLIDVPLDFLRECTNILLIRDPLRLIQSFTKVIKEPTMQDIGLMHEWELFLHIERETGAPPVVVDSGELLKAPESYMRKLCASIQIPFDRAMLSWKKGPRKEDGVWAKYWYGTVHQSTGFADPPEDPIQLNNQYHSLYEQALPYYEQLFHYAIKQD